MKTNLEDIINNNRESFDELEPSDAMWQRIEQRIAPANKKTGLLAIMPARAWAAAASVIVIIAVTAGLMMQNKKTVTAPDIATNTPPEKEQTVVADQPKQDDSLTSLPHLAATVNRPDNTVDTDPGENDEELYHYTKLVQIKQKQIMTLKKDEPLLYQQFAADFEKLETSFVQLKQQANNHPNKEQLLEAMIQNLQMQSALLSRQLEVIKNINNKKKKVYENASATI